MKPWTQSIQIKTQFVFQRWEEGDEAYHQELMVPALLIYGAQDKFVSLEEEQWMQEVSEITATNSVFKFRME